MAGKEFIILFISLTLASANKSLDEQLAQIKKLPEMTQKKIAVIMGTIVADAASTPLLWIYDEKVLLDIVKDEVPEFWPESKNPYNSVDKGTTMYLDNVMTTIDTVTKDDGDVSIKHLTKAILHNFGSPNSSYQIALKKRKSGAAKPIPGPWLTSCLENAMENMKKGKVPSGSETCNKDDGFFFGLPAFLLNLDFDIGYRIANMISTYSVVMANVEAQYILLAELLKPSTSYKGGIAKLQKVMKSKHPEITGEIQDVIDSLKEGATSMELVNRYGKGCELPGAFQGALASLLTKKGFKQVVLDSIINGGSNCARAGLLGAIHGAQEGIDAIPVDWMRKVKDVELVLAKVVRFFTKLKKTHQKQKFISSYEYDPMSKSSSYLVKTKNGGKYLIN